MLISGESIEEALSNVEWTTLSFFAGLFVIVGALAETGVIGMLANGLIDATGGNVFITIAGAAHRLGRDLQLPGQHPVRGHDDPHPAGHGIHRHGRHAAVVGRVAGRLPGRQRHAHRASANVVLSDISKKHGHEITFAKFFKTGFPIMLLTILIAGVYLVVRFPPA